MGSRLHESTLFKVGYFVQEIVLKPQGFHNFFCNRGNPPGLSRPPTRPKHLITTYIEDVKVCVEH